MRTNILTDRNTNNDIVPHPALKSKRERIFPCRKDGFYFMKKRKDGRYQKKVTLPDGRQRMVYSRTIAEVNQAADALRDQDRQGLVVGTVLKNSLRKEVDILQGVWYNNDSQGGKT